MLNSSINGACPKDKNKEIFITPASLLRELCAKNNSAPPTFNLIRSENKTNNQLFVYRSMLSTGLSATGEACSKQKAKQKSALNLLNKLKTSYNGINDDLVKKLDKLMNNLTIDTDEDPSKILESPNESHTDSSTDENELNLLSIQVNCVDPVMLDRIKKQVLECRNPVGDLNEMALKKSLKLPEFNFEDNGGPSHNKQFVCYGRFRNFNQNATARTKKEAKRIAALRLLYQVKASELNETLKPKKLENVSSEDFFDQLRQSKNAAMHVIKSKDLKKNHCRALLDQLSREENFNYDLFEIPSYLDGVLQYVLYIKKNPIILIGGQGRTRDEATQNTLFLTLSYIKACLEDK